MRKQLKDIQSNVFKCLYLGSRHPSLIVERKIEIVKIVHSYHGLSSSITLKPDVSIGIIFNSYLM